MKNKCPCCFTEKSLLIKIEAQDLNQEKSFEVFELNSSLIIKDHMLPHGITLLNKEPALVCNSCGAHDQYSLELEKVKSLIKSKNPDWFPSDLLN